MREMSDYVPRKKAFLASSSYLDDITYKRLNGALQATMDLRRVLVKYLNFEANNIITKTDNCPVGDRSKECLLSMMFNFVVNSQRGDLLLIHLCGHGSFRSGNDIHGNQVIRHFYHSANNEAISDEEFRTRIINNVPGGVTLVLICDFCFSGGFVRGLEARSFEFVDVDPNANPLPQAKSIIFMHSALFNQPCYSAIMASATDGIMGQNLATEVKGKAIFTGAITQTIEDCGGVVRFSYWQLINQCRRRVQRNQALWNQRTPVADRQQPGLSCTAHEAGLLFLGGNSGL